MDSKPGPARHGDHSGPAERGRLGKRPRAIGELVGRLVAKPLGKRGFAAAELAAAWPAIAGPALADSTLPLRVAFARGAREGGTLHLRVASGAVALQLQHLGPLILERVNGHYGYAAVARLALVQGPVPRRAAPSSAAVSRDAAKGELDRALAGAVAAVPDPELRAALDGLGRTLAGRWQRS